MVKLYPLRVGINRHIMRYTAYYRIVSLICYGTRTKQRIFTSTYLYKVWVYGMLYMVWYYNYYDRVITIKTLNVYQQTIYSVIA